MATESGGGALMRQKSTVGYMMSEADLRPAADFAMEVLPANMRALRRVPWLWAIILFALIFMNMAGAGAPVMGLAMGLMIAPCMAIFSRWFLKQIMRRQLVRAWRSAGFTVGHIKVSAGPEGLLVASSQESSSFAWQLVEEVHLRPGYTFIVLSQNRIVTIASQQVDPQNMSQFLEDLRRYQPQIKIERSIPTMLR